MRLAMERLNQKRSNPNPYICPQCGAVDWRGEVNSEVESTRHPEGLPSTVRRRLCHCGQHGFVTEETVVPEGYRVLVVPEEPESTNS